MVIQPTVPAILILKEITILLIIGVLMIVTILNIFLYDFLWYILFFTILLLIRI